MTEVNKPSVIDQQELLAARVALAARVSKFKQILQQCCDDTLRHAAKNTAPSGVAKKRIEKALGIGCELVENMLDLVKAKDAELISFGEKAAMALSVTTSIETDNVALKAKNQALEELDKCNESYLEDARAKINAMAEDACAKDKELINLRTSYTECLDRLFKAKVLRPGEIYNVGPLFLPQVTFTPENDGFYEVNPEWHNKVVGGLNLDLHGPADRRAYEMVLTSAVARLHNDNYPVAEGGKEKITVVVAWDAYLSVDRKSPTFSTGKLPLFKHEGNNHLDKVFEGLCEAIGLDEKRIASLGGEVISDTTVSGQVDTEEKSVVAAAFGDIEPSIFDRVQLYIKHGAFTLSKQYVVWYNCNLAKGEGNLDELIARTSFRNHLANKIANYLGVEPTPLLVIDWDVAAITGNICFICPELEKVSQSILKQLNEGLRVMSNGIEL